MFSINQKGEKKEMRIPSGVHYIKEPIVITEDDLDIIGEDGAILRGTVKVDSVWTQMDGGIYQAHSELKADALYDDGVKYRMARYPKYDPNIDVFGGYAGDCISREKQMWKRPL